MRTATLSQVEFLRGVSRWLEHREDAAGAAICPRHRVEHTGKLVYGAALDRALLELTGEQRFVERIRRRALRTVEMVRKDPRTGASVFFPGSLDPRNAASNLIDSGACCDVLAELCETVPQLFSRDERARIEQAVLGVAESYLAKAALVKEVPAQRLWGATGLARAARAFGRPELREAALAAVARAVAQANSDGSIPYMPEPQHHGEHPGLADVSPFYHSRHVGFIAYVHRCLEREPGPELRDFLRRALDFLHALYGKDGFKPLVHEAKQWYWESRYEVASHSFDVHALVEGARLFDSARDRRLAALSFQRLREHVLADGGVVSHHGPEVNFQCRDFWNGHVAWIARVVGDLDEEAPEAPPAGIEVFEDAGLVRVERADYVAVLRGRKQPVNISFGGEAGGGSLVYFGRRERGFENEIVFQKWGSLAPGNFTVTPASRGSFRERALSFYRDNRHDVRFRLYVADVERRAGNTGMALRYPLRHVVRKLRDEMKGRYASHFDVAPSLSWNGSEIQFASMLARRDGSVLQGTGLTRRYVAGEIELEVEETLVIELPVRALVYARIPTARDFAVECAEAAKEREEVLTWTPVNYPVTVRVRYRL